VLGVSVSGLHGCCTLACVCVSRTLGNALTHHTSSLSTTRHHTHSVAHVDKGLGCLLGPCT
jgi:hypothetical protein